MHHRSKIVVWLRSWLIFFSVSQLIQADIVSAEYFIGTDPGAGNGTSLVLTDPTSLATGFSQASLSLSGRQPGTYTVGVRVRDDLGRWSNPALRRFTLTTGSYQLAGGLDRNGTATQGMSNSSISGIGPFAGGANAEYFIGTDPGAGNGTALVVADTTSLATRFAQASLSLSGRQPSTYSVGIRVRDDQGRWSNPSIRRFTVQPAAVVAETTALAQAAASTDPAPPVSTSWSVSFPSLSGNSVSLMAGGHSLSFTRQGGETDAALFARIRTSLASNAYISSRFTVGAVSAGSFTLTAKTAGPSTDFALSSQQLQVTRVTDGTIGASGRKITAAEYFWDLDPGKGAGTPITVTTNGNDASISTQSLSLANLSGGNHRLGVRFKNAAGRWSNPVYRGLSSFVLFGDQDFLPPTLTLNGSSQMTISQGSVFTDPGVSASDAVDGNLTPKVVVTMMLDSTRAGVQTIEYAVVDRAGNISRIQRQVEVTAVDPNADGNSNRIADSWEQQFFPGQTVNPNADFDGDGVSNLMEYIAGTDPTLRSSAFRPIGTLSGTIYSMPMQTVVGRTYKVWVTRDLSNWTLRQTIVGDGAQKTFTFDETSVTSGPLHSATHPSRYFFRVEVSLP